MWYCCSLCFCSRLLGTLVLSLQHLMTSGRLILREALVDRNHRVTGVSPPWVAWPSLIRKALWETLCGVSQVDLGPREGPRCCFQSGRAVVCRGAATSHPSGSSWSIQKCVGWTGVPGDVWRSWMSRGGLAKPPQHWVMDAGGDRGGVPSTSHSVWAGANAGCEAEGSGQGEAEGGRVPWDPR